LGTLQNFTTPDLTTGQRVKDVGRYRWNWQKRAGQATASDFANLFTLVDAVKYKWPSLRGAGREVPGRGAMDAHVRRRTSRGNWDSYGNRNGQTCMLTSRNTTLELLIWDLDIALGGSADGPTSSLFAVSDTAISRMYSTPALRARLLAGNA